MISNERKELIKLIQNHAANKSGINLSALSDAELRQKAQKMLSAAAVKKVVISKNAQKQPGEKRNFLRKG